jgi:competence protein ComEC
LAALGVTRIDGVVLSHFHSDHIGGLAEVVAAYPVAGLVYGTACGQISAAKQVLATAAEANIPSQRLDSGSAMARVGQLNLTIYVSPANSACPAELVEADSLEAKGSGALAEGEESAANDAGLTVLATIGSTQVWLLGDLEADGQAALLRLAAGDILPGGVAVVAHHGSANQSERLAEALAPAISVISVGVGNPYGHPSAKTVGLYQRFGQVLRTDQQGLVALTLPDLPGDGLT